MHLKHRGPHVENRFSNVSVMVVSIFSIRLSCATIICVYEAFGVIMCMLAICINIEHQG